MSRNQPEQSRRRPGDPVSRIAPVVLEAAHLGDPAIIAQTIADDLDETPTAQTVLDAAAPLEDHALVSVSDDDKLTRLALGDAVTFVRFEPVRTVTLYAHVHYRDPAPKQVADDWVRRLIGQPAARLPGIGDRSVLGPYNPLGEYVGDGLERSICPTKEGHDLARAMHNAWLDLVGEDPAWVRAKEVTSDGH